MLAAIKDAYMTYDSRTADRLRLRYNNGKEFQFQKSSDGLYAFVDPKCNKVLSQRKI